MIYDIEKLIEVMDFRDRILTAEYEERRAGYLAELEELKRLNDADQKEIRLRAQALVERCDGDRGDVTKTELQYWFTGSRNRPMGRATLALSRVQRELDACERRHADRNRVGQLQEHLRVKLETGAALIETSELKQSGFSYEYADWFDRYNKDQIRSLYK